MDLPSVQRGVRKKAHHTHSVTRRNPIASTRHEKTGGTDMMQALQQVATREHVPSWHLCCTERTRPTQRSSHQHPRLLQACPGRSRMFLGWIRKRLRLLLRPQSNRTVRHEDFHSCTVLRIFFPSRGEASACVCVRVRPCVRAEGERE